MYLPNLRVLWRKIKDVTSVRQYTTKRTNVKKFAPCVLQNYHVLRITQSIGVNATDGFSVRNVSESFNSQSERQASLLVEKNMPKL